jgi:hypothetical protein
MIWFFQQLTSVQFDYCVNLMMHLWLYHKLTHIITWSISVMMYIQRYSTRDTANWMSCSIKSSIAYVTSRWWNSDGVWADWLTCWVYNFSIVWKCIMHDYIYIAKQKSSFYLHAKILPELLLFDASLDPRFTRRPSISSIIIYKRICFLRPLRINRRSGMILGSLLSGQSIWFGYG